jgi:hypothetical protein
MPMPAPSPGRQLPIRSWKKSSDYVNVFLGHNTGRVLPRHLFLAHWLEQNSPSRNPAGDLCSYPNFPLYPIALASACSGTMYSLYHARKWSQREPEAARWRELIEKLNEPIRSNHQIAPRK